MFRLDAESAHELAIESLRLALASETSQRIAAERFESNSFPELERFGLRFRSPIGIAAGFDKNGIVFNQLAALGFGFVEVGTVTLRPQKGNEKPRLFRLPEDQALINRLGFNNDGARVVADRLRHTRRRCVVGVNIGKNKDVPNEEAVENYLGCLDIVHAVADYIVVNISSPNTPGLRDLQRGKNLESLIGALMERVGRPVVINAEAAEDAETARLRVQSSQKSPPLDPPSETTKPLLIKIAPDLEAAEIEEIVDVCTRLGVSGIIATNTTISRDGLRTRDTDSLSAGGLSGRPLAARSNQVIETLYRYSKGRLPIVGVGGIFTPQDAFAKIAAGASLLQAYTGFVYGGPSFARDINVGLAKLLEERGFASIDEAVGSSVSAG